MITEMADQILHMLQISEECSRPIPLKIDEFPVAETDIPYTDRYDDCKIPDSNLKACVMLPDPLDERRKIQ